MLVYAFWHWPDPSVDVATYETLQCAFQAALADHPPPGFLRGTTMRLSGAPWAAGGGAAYEDWYLVQSMKDLPALNDAAVSGPRKAPHDAVARAAAGGTAGLYGLRGGAPVARPAVAVWFSKPAGMPYAELFAELAPLCADGALWMRQMVLGPTPEFCLHCPEPVKLPGRLSAALTIPLAPVWNRPG